MQQVKFLHHTDENAKAAGIVHEFNNLVYIWFNRLWSVLIDISEFTLVKFNVVYDCFSRRKVFLFVVYVTKIDPVFSCLRALIIAKLV
jgi:hypothetical protein